MADLYEKLQSGDIGATRGRGVVGWLAKKLFAPETDRFHHFLLGGKPYDGDRVIFESIAKGIAVGRLSFYKGKDIKFYRVNCSDEIKAKVIDQVTKYGRSPYDYWLLAKIFLFSFILPVKILIREHKLRRLTADDLPYSSDAAYICTEAVDIPYWDLGFEIIPKTRATLPCAIKQAELEGRIAELLEPDIT